jgi:uncharacterized membrane protein YoaK (UPF0700 family)
MRGLAFYVGHELTNQSTTQAEGETKMRHFVIQLLPLVLLLLGAILGVSATLWMGPPSVAKLGASASRLS